MFEAIKNFVNDLANGEKSSPFEDHDFRVAYAALLVHTAAIDGDVNQPERDALVALLRERFSLDRPAVDELIVQATAAEERAVDFYHFTHTISGALDQAERLRVVEMMWAVAFADGKITDYEDNLVWRVADLLGVSSAERIALRQRVGAENGEA